MIKGNRIVTIEIKMDSSFIMGLNNNHRLWGLKIEFKNGSVFKYYDLPGDVVYDLLKSDSQAKYVNLHIWGKYNSEKVK